jgi:D-glycero-alpha-D-manno-heptose-7-phosphate kinase
LEIVHSADLPAQSGLGASSSFTVGLLNALTTFSGQKFSKKKLFSTAINIEQNLIKEHVGSQDQVAAANGGLNIINFYKNKIEVIPVKNHKNVKDLEKSLFLFFIGYPRESSKIEYSKIKKFSSNQIYLNEIFKITKDAEFKIQSSKNIVSDFSELLDKYWYFKKKLSPKVSNKKIDKLYNLAIEFGAYSGKLVGAGGGGFLMFLVDPKKRSVLEKIFKNYKVVPIEFENEGSKIVYSKKD